MLEVNFDPFPELTTERLMLRQVAASDAPEMFYLRSHPELMKYICKPKPRDMDDILQFIQNVRDMIAANDGVAWAMTMKGDNKLIGHISFHVLMKEHYRAEVGYILHHDQHGKGYMDEALKAILDYGFNKMGLHSVEANVSPENTASRRLLERNGFVQEAHFRENYYWEGEFLDSVIYSLVNRKQ